MDKIKKRNSLKWSLVKYMPLWLITSVIGVYAIGIGTNHLQEWYERQYAKQPLSPSLQKVMFGYDDDGNPVYRIESSNNWMDKDWYKHQLVAWLIGYGQALWMVLWVTLCLVITGRLFYNRELKKPITMLMDASQKISENNLDFCLEYKKENEMGLLCGSFEEMRKELDKNNREMWNLLEERKRLNRAFSHDLRTPLTVLRGYTDFLTRYVPEGQVSAEKMAEILSMINGQVERLENYTEKMTAVQNLSELVCEKKNISSALLLEQLKKSGEMLCGQKAFCFENRVDSEDLFLDEEFVMEIYENLVSNAARYAHTKVTAVTRMESKTFLVTVEDDGEGFSEEGLECASNPFYREDKENDKVHFGMGLYICKLLCERCGGELIVENGSVGGKVTAKFYNC